MGPLVFSECPFNGQDEKCFVVKLVTIDMFRRTKKKRKYILLCSSQKACLLRVWKVGKQASFNVCNTCDIYSQATKLTPFANLSPAAFLFLKPRLDFYGKHNFAFDKLGAKIKAKTGTNTNPGVLIASQNLPKPFLCRPSNNPDLKLWHFVMKPNKLLW